MPGATLPRFPAWLTIPANYNLALSRRWHLFFALVLAFGLLAYMIASLLNRHFQRDLALRRAELTPAAYLGTTSRRISRSASTIRRHPRAYNVFQKLSYVARHLRRCSR